VLPPETPAPFAFELAKAVERQVFLALAVPVTRLTPGPRRTTAGSRLDDDQRRLFLLRYLGRCQPALLQERKLVKQRFLQRSSHILSLRLAFAGNNL
jgi:hypothetical protein